MSARSLADAIVVFLNQDFRDYSRQFVAERRAVPFTKPEQLGTVKVSVFAGTKKAKRASRDRRHPFQHTYKPVIVVQKKLIAGDDPSQLAELDELTDFADELELSLQTAEFEGVALENFDEEQDKDTYGLEALRDHGCFATAITLQYIER